MTMTNQINAGDFIQALAESLSKLRASLNRAITYDEDVIEPYQEIVSRLKEEIHHDIVVLDKIIYRSENFSEPDENQESTGQERFDDSGETIYPTPSKSRFRNRKLEAELKAAKEAHPSSGSRE